MDRVISYPKKFNVLVRDDYTESYLNVPIKMWLSTIERGALDQLYNIANLPFVFKHIAAMPDCHQGYGMPIGGVMATKGYVVPNAVGVDIGCGMICVRISLYEIPTDILKKIMGDIRRLVPVGFNKHKKAQEGMPIWDPKVITPNIVSSQYENAEKSLGTLGGGNHFIEVQKGDDAYLYVMIHSGSRNLGLKIANHYNGLAIEKNEEWHSSVPKKWQLAFLPIHSRLGRAYLTEMDYAVKFAYANRLLMMDRVEEAFKNHIDVNFYSHDMINIAHNYAKIEHHFGENVIVHRKGATSAYKGELGIIPGSQGTTSFIVRGRGNPESFMSCSHGAGRLMGRKEAQRVLDLDEEKLKLDSRGIIHSIRGVKDLDEASGAYKDINEVMRHQMKLVGIERILHPLAVVKG
jgi:tRNA-splicing ligase RtcB